MAEGVEIEPAEASNAGKNWKAANNTVIKNLGKKKIEACTDEGHSVMLDVQIAENLTKFLGSAFRIARAGNSVVFHPPGYDDYTIGAQGSTPKPKKKKVRTTWGCGSKPPKSRKKTNLLLLARRRGGHRQATV